MKLHMILFVGVVLCVTGCTEKEQVSSEPVDEAPVNEAVAITAGNDIWRDESFVKHMHLHAEKLEDLNFALADGDLEAAKTSANWISTHDTDIDIQSDWLPYLNDMRTEAESVESAPDLATAQAAAERITARCQECHIAVGVSTQ